MTVSLGVHVGQQNLSMTEMRALWRRLDAAGIDWISVWDHFYEAPFQGGTQAALRGPGNAWRLGRRHRARPDRLPRVLRRLPEPRPPRQGGIHAGSSFRRALRTRPRCRLARVGSVGLRLRFSRHRHAPRHARRGDRDHSASPQRRTHHVFRSSLPSRRRDMLAEALAAQPALVDRRSRRATDARDRRATRRWLERRVHECGRNSVA